MEGDISNSEIRDAVWECGGNKSPGLDGFTFEFFRRYWNLIGSDFCDAVIYFFADGFFPKGNNASFITLIPKVIDAKFVTDFRPISLIGSVYKVVTKILANRLSSVISDLVSESQSAFIANRQILDGPFILMKYYRGVIGKRNKLLFSRQTLQKLTIPFDGITFWKFCMLLDLVLIGVNGFVVFSPQLWHRFLSMEVLLLSSRFTVG